MSNKKNTIFGFEAWKVVIGIIILIFIVSGGRPLEKLAGEISGSTLYTQSDYQSGICKLAEAEYATISCLALGDPIPTTYSAKQGEVRSFTVSTIDTKVERHINNAPQSSWLEFSEGATPASRYICGDSLETISNQVARRDCFGVQLTTSRAYNFKVLKPTICLFNCEQTSVLEISGRVLGLRVSIPQVGIVEAKLPESINCVINSDTLRKVQEQAGSSVYINTAEVTSQVTSMKQGDTVQVARGIYRENAGIISNFYGDSKIPSVCDIARKKVYGFSKATGSGGQCYAIQDPSRVLLDGSGASFCCGDSQCSSLYGLDTNYKCVDNICKKATTGNQQCITTADCQYLNNYYQKSDGSYIERTATCQQSVCVASDKTVVCDPTRAYSNNQCCYNIGGTLQLTSCIQGKTSCEQLGSNVCCTDKQTRYTIKPAPFGTYCCDPESDGIGTIVESQAKCSQFNQCSLRGEKPSLLSPCCQGLIENDDAVCALPDEKEDNSLLLILIILLVVVVMISLGIIALSGSGRRPPQRYRGRY